MSIHHPIKRQKFNSLGLKTLLNVLYTADCIEKKINRFFSKYALTNQQYNILRILRGVKGYLSIKELRNRMIQDKSDVSRLIKRLEVKGLIKKEPSSQDKRFSEVTLTPLGYDLLKVLDPEVTILYNFIDGVDKDKLEAFNELMDFIQEDSSHLTCDECSVKIS